MKDFLIMPMSKKQQQDQFDNCSLTNSFYSQLGPEIPELITYANPYAPYVQIINKNLSQIIKELALTLHSSENYFIKKNSSKRYYPQLNGSFYVANETSEPRTNTTISFYKGKAIVNNNKKNPLASTFLISKLKLFSDKGFNINDNWTFNLSNCKHLDFNSIKEFDSLSLKQSGVSYFQLDGSIWCSNKTTLYLDKNNVLQCKINSQPIPFTISYNNLYLPPLRYTATVMVEPNNPKSLILIPLGSLQHPDHAGSYLLQYDTTIFYTGMKTIYETTLPYTLIKNNKNSFCIDHKRNTILPSTLTLNAINAYISQDGTWCIHSDDLDKEPFRIALLNNKKFIRFRYKSSDLSIYEYNPVNNSWDKLPDRTDFKSPDDKIHSDPQIQSSIKQISSTIDSFLISSSNNNIYPISEKV